MDLELDGKAFLITGGTDGLGLALAAALAVKKEFDSQERRCAERRRVALTQSHESPRRNRILSNF